MSFSGLRKFGQFFADAEDFDFGSRAQFLGLGQGRLSGNERIRVCFFKSRIMLVKRKFNLRRFGFQFFFVERNDASFAQNADFIQVQFIVIADDFFQSFFVVNDVVQLLQPFLYFPEGFLPLVCVRRGSFAGGRVGLFAILVFPFGFG